MRCFVSDIDTPLGHNLSRLLSLTAVGSRKEGENEEEENASGNEDGGGDKAETGSRNKKETYQVWGTLTKTEASEAQKASYEAGFGKPIPFDTGDRKRDSARRDVIEKIATHGKASRWIKGVVANGDQEALKEALLASDVIVYDLLQSLDEAAWAIEMLSEQSESFAQRPKTFIAISSVMTWAKTKIDQEDSEAFLAEDEYRRRKPHPNYKNHINVEKNVIKFGKKSSLKTYVIAPGLVYHSGENLFHYLFKAAWHNSDLVCYGEGANMLPTIHLDDLCNIVTEIIEIPPESRYILAIDESKNTLYEITKGISEALGTGRVRKVAAQSALLNRNLPQSDFDMLLINLRLEPGHVKDMTFEWKFESGILENLPQLIQDFKDSRGLAPLKIVLHGPPASGKSTIAKALAEHYDLHLVEKDAVVKEAIARLVALSNTERRVAGNLQPDENTDDLDADHDLLEELREAAKTNNGKYPEDNILGFIRDKLRSMPCKNQGFILDGMPNSITEATTLFKYNDDEGKEGIDELTAPEFLLTLQATDEFIKERTMNLPEAAIADTKNSEEQLTKRLEEFRSNNTEENTVLNYFDEQEIHPVPITVDSNNLQAVLDVIISKIGKPHNYGPTPEQIAEKRRILEEAKAREVAIAEEERQRREKEESERHHKAVAEWNARMEEIRKQEQEVLEAQSVPLRNYLMKYVMPTLTAGLIDVCKVRPEDPVDYLAEYLFKHNASNLIDEQ